MRGKVRRRWLVAALAVAIVGCLLATAGPLQGGLVVATAGIHARSTVKAGGLDERGHLVAPGSFGATARAVGKGGAKGVRSFPLGATTLPPVGAAKTVGGSSGTVQAAGSSAGGAGTAALPLATTSPAVKSRFTGIADDGFYPPDSQMAVNKTTVLEVVNSELRVTTLTGKLLAGPVTLNAFFSLPTTDSVSDVQALCYSFSGGRFIFTAVDFTTNTGYIAISQANSAVGSCWVYYYGQGFNGYANYMDQPVFGFTTQDIGVDTNQYDSTFTTFYGSIGSVFGAAKMMKGTFSFQVGVISTGSSYASVHPARSVTNNGTGSPLLYWATTGGVSGSTSLWVYATFGLPGSVALQSIYVYPIANTGFVPGAPQAGTAALITTDDGRVQSVSWAHTGSGGSLWVTYSTSCIPVGDNTARACVRVDEISTDINYMAQDTDTGVAGYYLFYGALTALPGLGPGYLMIVGFSGPLSYPSVAVTGQFSTDVFGTFRGPTLVFSGVSYDTSQRYGDYSGAQYYFPSGSINPTAWGVTEFDKAPSVWSTEVVHFGF